MMRKRTGRPKKETKNRGRPSLDGPDALARSIEKFAPPTVHVKHDAEAYSLLPGAPMSLEDLECSICYGVLDQPVELPCGKLACASCCVEWVLVAPGVSCPASLDPTPLDKSDFRPPPAVILKLLSAVLHSPAGGVGRE